MRHGTRWAYTKHGCRCDSCRQAAREGDRRMVTARYHRRRQQLVEEMGGVCVRCGSTEDLHLDHIKATEKDHAMDRLLERASWAKIRAEAAKCQLLCRSHHSEKTNREERVYACG